MVPKVSKMTPTAQFCYTWCAALLGSLAFSSPVQAQNKADSPTIHISRAPEPPRLEWFVDGSNGAPHDRGTTVTDFLQREPGDGEPVSQSTAAFLSYDDAHLYVVFVCRDEPAAVRANVARREDIDSDDGVAVYLDTFHPNSWLTREEDGREWSGDFLLTYLVNPGTAVYVGYIDKFENIDIVPGSPPSLRRIGGTCNIRRPAVVCQG